MAKADINLPNGTKITIDGNVDDITKILDLIKNDSQAKSINNKKDLSIQAKKKSGAKEHIRNLKAEGYFKQKRTIGDIQKSLKESGYIYETTSLSKPLLELTQAKELARINENGQWAYIQRS